MFWREYVERSVPFELTRFHAEGSEGRFRCTAAATRDGTPFELSGEGNGPIAAFAHALTRTTPSAGPLSGPFEIAYYCQHALGTGSEASAIAYIQLTLADGRTRWGAGVDTHIELASIKAVLSALNRALLAAR